MIKLYDFKSSPNCQRVKVDACRETRENRTGAREKPAVIILTWKPHQLTPAAILSD